jgi:hypothetical protein
MKLKGVYDNRYIDHGYKNRGDYLESLADDYGVDPSGVAGIADALGPFEDFDGLISMLENSGYMGLLPGFRIKAPEENLIPMNKKRFIIVKVKKGRHGMKSIN